MPFRYHLRADENIRLALGKFGQYFKMPFFRLRGVSVHSEYARFREQFFKFRNHAFGAESAVSYERTSALRTRGNHFVFRAAVMAKERLVFFMISQGDVARIAFLNVSAFGAYHRFRVAALVEKYYRLIAVFKTILYFFFKGGRKRRIVAAPYFLSHIHHVDDGQRLFVYSVGKFHEIVNAVFRL